MNRLNNILEFLKHVVFTTFNQLIWLFGLILIFGFILYLLARFTRKIYIKTTGTTLDIIVTGWIGTPIHELGHIIFCLLFRHKIDDFKLYAPNSEDGTLGYVNHSFNPKSIYQKVGNFFIGTGPILFGSLLIYALFYYLVPNNKDVFSSLESQSKVLIRGLHGDFSGVLGSLWSSTINTLESIFRKDNFSNYRFWIFLYLSMCISSHMELSPQDIKGAWKGVLSIILLFLIINFIIFGIETTRVSTQFGSWWNYFKLESYSLWINKWVGTFGALFIFSSILSGLNFFITYSGLTIYSLIKGDGFVNPF